MNLSPSNTGADAVTINPRPALSQYRSDQLPGTGNTPCRAVPCPVSRGPCQYTACHELYSVACIDCLGQHMQCLIDWTPCAPRIGPCAVRQCSMLVCVCCVPCLGLCALTGCVPCALCRAPQVLCCVCYAQCAVHGVLCTMCCARCAVHGVLCTACCEPCAIGLVPEDKCTPGAGCRAQCAACRC